VERQLPGNLGGDANRLEMAESRPSLATAYDPKPTLGNTGSGRSMTNQLAAPGPTQSVARGMPLLNAGSGCVQHMEEIIGLFLDTKPQAFIEALRGIDLQHA
jgi:hypothetical protein